MKGIKMKLLVAGIFADSEKAGSAVKNLKSKGYANHISILAKDEGGDTKEHHVKENPKEGILAGASLGAPVGALMALIIGATAVATPGGILLVAGPLAASWGVAGSVAGMLGGGLLGALVELGFAKNAASYFDSAIENGEVMVTVSTDKKDAANSIVQTMDHFDAHTIAKIPQIR